MPTTHFSKKWEPDIGAECFFDKPDRGMKAYKIISVRAATIVDKFDFLRIGEIRQRRRNFLAWSFLFGPR